MLLQRLWLRTFSTTVFLTMLVSCAPSKPTQFYTLSGLDDSRTQVDAKPLSLGIGAVSLPAYLDRPQIVTREGANRVAVAEFDQWAEPLEITFQRVLGENLSSRLGIDLVVSLPSRRNLPLDRQIEVEVTRFDADEAGQIVLDAGWWVFDGSGGRMLDQGRSVIRQQVMVPGDYEQIAEAMSLCLAEMSIEIADRIDGS